MTDAIMSASGGTGRAARKEVFGFCGRGMQRQASSAADMPSYTPWAAMCQKCTSGVLLGTSWADVNQRFD